MGEVVQHGTAAYLSDGSKAAQQQLRVVIEKATFPRRSYWIPGSYAPALSEKGNAFLRLLNNKGFREESMTKVELDAIGTSTTLKSNKRPKELATNV